MTPSSEGARNSEKKIDVSQSAVGKEGDARLRHRPSRRQGKQGKREKKSDEGASSRGDRNQQSSTGRYTRQKSISKCRGASAKGGGPKRVTGNEVASGPHDDLGVEDMVFDTEAAFEVPERGRGNKMDEKKLERLAEANRVRHTHLAQAAASRSAVERITLRSAVRRKNIRRDPQVSHDRRAHQKTSIMQPIKKTMRL